VAGDVTGFGDADPEDAYDASDPIPVRVRALARIAAGVADDTTYRALVRARALAVLLARLADDLEAGDG
jgi:hypothetical protein